ncbi:DUF1540 domain-containing protein [Bacillus sp. V3B]|nr:DUF1540 domain-containing protein [Bacillus sp. V3B]MCQ6274470.1 DUF1540 domain-containing protein [Bacillus sp. V3B]
MAKDVLYEVHNCTFWESSNLFGADQIYVVSHVGHTADDQKQTD